MEPSIERPRKRRAINACTSCRVSKVRCDGQRPCKRCRRNDVECQYLDAVKDANVLRIEKLEEVVESLRVALRTNQAQPTNTVLRPTTTAPRMEQSQDFFLSASEEFRPTLSTPPLTAVQKGLITWEQAEFYFQSFFFGSHYLVPIFCLQTDTLQSIFTRSAFLFDTIASIGCRAEEGFTSPTYQCLSCCLREHLTSVLIQTSMPSIETIQALAVRAAYSDDGFVYIALALKFAIQLRLPDMVEERLMTMASTRRADAMAGEEEKELYRLARVWFGICNLELLFSLDGGKIPGITLRTSSRRIHFLVNHPERTAIDVRLLSQIELNIIRTNAYSSIAQQHSNTSLIPESHLRSTIKSTSVELSLWLDEWTGIVASSNENEYEREMALLNLRVQYNWALITLHLKALSNTGIENVAIMTEFQREVVRIAKDAAVSHLQHLLERPLSMSPNADGTSPPPYLAAFKYTMDFVWAKCAFSILLVLKLSLLLHDPLPTVLSLLQNAYVVFGELKKVTAGKGKSRNGAYLEILQTSIEKCEGALREFIAKEQEQLDVAQLEGEERRYNDDESVEDAFQGYAPSEFVFEWDFPGLNLRCVPLGWQDLFVDLDRVF
ncbi:hypothetical protein P280DRAFT_407200 [Massarina eburnea CBS 473.64]|uniref:Zn(2)-C6 fungal-type domain-containing protein n=1 Tax=Massarina eburnea CBS 473.64 TaxID=1395130 RepID=A0A6A6RT86_9PLEO|nr:hypothetical protein P280DRAFT_407200 [Massarina eburnea CBS 473.64]